MTAPVKELKLKKSDGAPTIEIVVGFALWGTYKFKIWNKQGQEPETIGSGFSDDAIDDEFKIGGITTLNERFLTWKATLAGFEESDHEQYHVTILIRQKGKTVSQGVFTHSGVLDGVVQVGGAVKLKVV